eukprot:1763913-Rhodomonas_salina.6
MQRKTVAPIAPSRFNDCNVARSQVRVQLHAFCVELAVWSSVVCAGGVGAAKGAHLPAEQHIKTRQRSAYYCHRRTAMLSHPPNQFTRILSSHLYPLTPPLQEA